LEQSDDCVTTSTRKLLRAMSWSIALLCEELKKQLWMMTQRTVESLPMGHLTQCLNGENQIRGYKNSALNKSQHKNPVQSAEKAFELFDDSAALWCKFHRNI
jgi:hypothetical protein